MNQIIEFFKKLFDSSDWPPRWHCGRWTEFHGWLYIISDLLIWSAYFTIPIVIIRYISKKQGIRFERLYFLFAAFILACGATHFLDAVAFWIPAYRLNALVRLITGILSWTTVFYLVKLLPAAFSLKSQKELEVEIGQRKKAEEKFKGLLEAAPDAMIIANNKGEITLVNHQAEIIFGYQRGELIGKPIEILIPTAFHNKHVDHRTKYFGDPKVRSMGAGLELYALRKDGTQFHVEISLSPLTTEEGTLVSASVRDITDRKHIEAQIQKQKQELQDFIDSMSTLSAKVATDGKLLVVNKIAMQASGLPMDELLKTNFLEGQWWTFDPQVQSRVKDAFEKACSGTIINYDENIFVFGQILTINFSLTPIMKPGKNEVDYIVAEARDITAQKKAEEKLKESEHMFSSLFYKSPIMKAIAEASTGKYLETNDALANFFELPKEQIIGKTSTELNMLVRPEERQQIIDKLKTDGFVRDIETEITSKSGETRWVSTSIDKINLNGKDCFLTAAIDITARKKAEEEIRQMNLELEKRVKEKTEEVIQNEKRFRSLIENSNEVIIVTDLEGNRIFVSEGIKRMLGYTPQEYMKLNIFNMVPPEEAHSVRQLLQKIVDNPGKSFSINVHVQHKNGSWRWIEAVLSGFLDVPGLNGIVINYRDVTERKEAEDKLMVSESRFRSIIEQFPYPVVTYTPNGDYTTANMAWEVMWQYKREDVKEYNIRKDPQMSASGLSKYVEKAFAGEVATSEPYLYDPRLIGHDSRKRWMQMTLYPLKNDHGEILEVILILLDVTVNKEAEAEIKILNESLEKKVVERTMQLETVNKELESFAYSVSHDLRAPLRIIDGYSEMIVSDYAPKLDEEGQRMINIIMANARKMGQLIDDLLNLSRLGRKELLFHPVNMNQLVRSVLEEFDQTQKEKAEIKVGDLLPASCDTNLLRQVWINLISNAIKYSGKRQKPEIEISSYKESKEIVYYIKDNGVGFDMKYAGQLYGVFQRLHKATEFEGTGVGLALVKRIIIKHGGRVWAQSEVDKGASFFFSLPENSY